MTRVGALRRMIRFSPRHPEDWVAWTLRVALVGAVAWYFVTDAPLVYTTGPVLSGAVAAGLLGALVLSAFPARSLRGLRVVEALWSVLFLLHFLGHAKGLYLTAYYDVALHASGGLLGGVITFIAARSTTWFWDAGGETPFRAFFVVIAVVTLGGVTVELGEFGADAAFGTAEQADPFQESLPDTMTDVLAQTVTGLAAATSAGIVAHHAPAPAPAAAADGRRTRSAA